MPDKQHALGQFETPPDVADLLLGFCLRRPSDRLLDPSCGSGALLRRAAQWQQWIAAAPDDIPPDTLCGVELDPNTAVSAQTNLPQATIRNQNFFALPPDPQHLYDAIIGNPPYTRAEWLGALRQTAQQLTFDWAAPMSEDATPHIIPPDLWTRLSPRAGLHAYFFLHGVHFLREGGRFGFVVPNGWLDVAYGVELKQFLLSQFKLIAIIESGVERWFDEAKINTCLVILEKCSGPNRRAENLVRLIRLKRPLSDLFPATANDYRRPQAVERLVTRLLPGQSRHSSEYDVQIIPQRALLPTARWGTHLRAPTIYTQRREQADLLPLQTWAAVQRGYTTGANEFFYLDTPTIAKWGIEAEFRQPVVKSLRGIDRLRLTRADCRYELLQVPPDATLTGTAVADYIAWGETQGFHQRHTCAVRALWYSLPPQNPAPVLLPKGIWRRHLAPLLAEPLPVDQQLYQFYLAADVPVLAAAALLNCTWFMLQCELNGRTNFGAGVLWLAAYELAALRLPDPRSFSPAQTEELAHLFTQLAQRPCLDIEEELNQADRLALDTAVFRLMHFSPDEETAVRDGLRERVQTRRRRAAKSK
ncbi:MAG: N-6 DNA methylase [Chloroflexota bacterium]